MKNFKKTIGLLLLVLVAFSSCKKDEPDTPILSDVIITEDITANTTWYATNIYIIENSIDITNNSTLIIEPGTVVKFKAGITISVSYSSGSFGNIKAIGTALKPILFTSFSTTKTKGDWDGIWIYDGSSASEFDFCVFEYAGGDSWSGGNGAITVNYGKNVSITNCTFKNSASYGVRIYADYDGLSNLSNCTFSDNATNDIKLYSNNVQALGTGNSYTGSIDVRGADIDMPGDVLWKYQNTDFIMGDFNTHVGSSIGTKLIIEAGNVLKFGNNTELKIGYNGLGFIEAKGTATNPVTFTSSSSYPSKGDWDGIWFYSDSGNGSIFEYCNISYGGGYNDLGNINFKYEQGSKVTVSNCNISDSKGYGIAKDQSDSSDPSLSNNTFTNNTLGDINW